MQFKLFAVLASLAAVAVAVPYELKRDDTPVSAATPTLTTFFTTETFTAPHIKPSMLTEEPWHTMVTTSTTWTVARTVTRAVSPTAA